MLLLTLLAACEPAPVEEVPDEPFEPEYGSIETALLEDDLVSFTVLMRGARDATDVQAFGDCAAAQYAVIRGYGFVRHIGTFTDEKDGLWRGEGVYTISETVPRGVATIDANITLAECREAGIPTV